MGRNPVSWKLVDNHSGKVLFRSKNRVLVAGWHRVIGATVVPVFKKSAESNTAKKHDTAIPAGRHRTDKAAGRTRRDRPKRRCCVNDKPTPEGWMTKDQRLRALVSGSDRHRISSDTLFAVLSALESNFFYSGDGDEYNNDEVISAFKALAGELELAKTTVAIKSNEPAAWIAFATDGSESSAVYLMREQAQAAADDWGWSIAPLYEQPQPALNDDEIDAIEHGLERLELHSDSDCEQSAATLRSLLKRLG
jgi:hypothetical protein